MMQCTLSSVACVPIDLKIIRAKSAEPNVNHIACVLILIALAVPANGREPKLNHGERELKRILEDRPSMIGILPDDDVVTRWVVRKLCTGAGGERVSWDNTEPDGGIAQHVPGDGNSPARVRLTASKSMTGRDKWYLLVFELHNLLHPAHIDALKYAATTQTLARKEFTDAILDHECERLARTNRFFLRYPLPDATEENAPVYSAYMRLKTEPFNREVRAHMIKHVGDTPYGAATRKAYGDWYDQIRARANW